MTIRHDHSLQLGDALSQYDQKLGELKGIRPTAGVPNLTLNLGHLPVQRLDLLDRRDGDHAIAMGLVESSNGTDTLRQYLFVLDYSPLEFVQVLFDPLEPIVHMDRQRLRLLDLAHGRQNHPFMKHLLSRFQDATALARPLLGTLQQLRRYVAVLLNFYDFLVNVSLVHVC